MMLAYIHLSFHPYIHLFSKPLILLRVLRVAGPFPSMDWAHCAVDIIFIILFVDVSFQYFS